MRTVFGLALLMLPLATAQQPVPMSHGVPDDMHFFVHGTTSRTPDPDWARFERAIAMLADSGIHEDVIDLATAGLGPRERDQVHGVMRRVTGLLARVDWPLLVERELVFAYRMSLPIPEYVFLFRVPEELCGEQAAQVHEMLDGFAELLGLPPGSVRDVERPGGALTILEARGVPVQFACGAVGDVLVMSTSTRLAATSMRLLKGGGARSLGGAEPFVRDLERLPAPTENVLYVDARGLVDFYRQLLRMARLGVDGQGRPASREADVLDFVMALLDEVDVVDHVVTTTRSDGATTSSTSRIRMVPDFDGTAMAAVLGRQQPWTNWRRRVPADAAGFGFDGGFDCAALYDLVVARMRESGQLGELLQEHAEALAAMRRVLGYFSGEFAWVSLPADGEGCPLGDMVCAVRLEDADGMASALAGWIDDVSQFLASRGQDMTVVRRDGAYEVGLAAFPWIRPTVAVRGDELVVATSASALRRVERVQQGRAPDIRTRADVVSLFRSDREHADGLAYGRVATSMGSLPDLLSAVGFGLSVLPEARDAPALRPLGAIFTKLAPALRELDASYEWAMEAIPGDAPDTWITRSVYRFDAHQ